MAELLLDVKLTRAFNQIDTNRDGVIDLTDLLLLGTRLVAAYEQPATGRKANQLANGMRRFWLALAEFAGIAVVERLTRAEYVEAMVSGFIHAPVDVYSTRGLGDMVSGIIALMDGDGDGQVTRSEFYRALAVLGSSGEEMSAAWDLIDGDEDGLVAVTRVAAAAQEFYVGTDPLADGNSLFGPLGVLG